MIPQLSSVHPVLRFKSLLPIFPMANSINSEIPGYTITRHDDLSLHFYPSISSLELANALSYKYLMEPDLEKKIRRTILDHIIKENEQQVASSSSSNKHSGTSSMLVTNASHNASTKHTNWRIETGEPIEPRRKKAAYCVTKRKKIAQVRQRGACAYHRKRKQEV